MLSNTASTSKTLSSVSIEEKTESTRFSPDSSTGGLFQNCKIGAVNVQVYSGRAEQPSRIRSEKRLKITVSYYKVLQRTPEAAYAAVLSYQ